MVTIYPMVKKTNMHRLLNKPSSWHISCWHEISGQSRSYNCKAIHQISYHQISFKINLMSGLPTDSYCRCINVWLARSSIYTLYAVTVSVKNSINVSTTLKICGDNQLLNTMKKHINYDRCKKIKIYALDLTRNG